MSVKECFILFLSLVLIVTGRQSAVAQIDNNDRFEIVLPELWKNKPKLIFKLSDIIRSHIPQLVTKNECTNCNANYHVSFSIYSPIVDYTFPSAVSVNEFTTIYRFYAYMDVSDSSRKVFHRLILNDTSTTHVYKHKFFSKGSLPPPVQNSFDGLKQLPAVPEYGQRDLVANRKYLIDEVNKAEYPLYTSDQYSNASANQSILIPKESDMWIEVENIIREFDLKKFVAGSKKGEE